jgi:hypothetical protein
VRCKPHPKHSITKALYGDDTNCYLPIDMNLDFAKHPRQCCTDILLPACLLHNTHFHSLIVAGTVPNRFRFADNRFAAVALAAAAAAAAAAIAAAAVRATATLAFKVVKQSDDSTTVDAGGIMRE